MSFAQDTPIDGSDLLVLVVDKDPQQRQRLLQALDSLGILGPKEVDDQFEGDGGHNHHPLRHGCLWNDH